MKGREIAPEHLVSLSGIEGMKGMGLNGKGELKIGALTTLAEIEHSDVVKEHFLPSGGCRQCDGVEPR